MSSNTILIVFLAVVIIYLLVRLMGKKPSNATQNEVQPKADAPQPQVAAATASNEIQGEVLAAIFMALEESKSAGRNVLTFRQVNREYSPWNSKIYNMRQLPRR